VTAHLDAGLSKQASLEISDALTGLLNAGHSTGGGEVARYISRQGISLANEGTYLN
jgi:hypothetical protein